MSDNFDIRDRSLMTKKEIKQEEKRAKQFNKDMAKRKKANTTGVPKTTQQTIPYVADYDEGLIEIEPGRYSKTLEFADINYQIAKEEDQIAMFCKYGEFLNYFSSDIDVSITINNKAIDAEKQLNSIMLQEKNDEYDVYREEYNAMLRKQFTAGRNDIQREKYVTVVIDANDPYDALYKFSRIETEIIANFRKIGSDARVLSTEERLMILHDFYKGDWAGQFSVDFSNVKAQGITSKDLIAPESFNFKNNSYFEMGETYHRCVFVNNLPTDLRDSFLAELTDFSFPMMTTMSIKAVNSDKAMKLVKRQITGMEANKIDAQRKAIKAGYDPEMISHDLKHSLTEAEQLLDDLQNNNQKMFFVSIGIMFGGNTLEELEQNTLLISSVARKYMCQIQKLIYQQEDAMKQILPLGHNLLPIRRTLTTESTAVFIPFTGQELIDQGGMYYGINGISRNLIMHNRKLLNNSNGFILGESGSGKSFASKREQVNILLNTDDDIIIIDPESEYGDLARNLGGEVIDITAGSKTYINPLDMEYDYGIDENPIIAKSDFILSLCECMLGGKVCLSPSQRTIVDRCVNIVYQEYIQDFNQEKQPTLLDFYNVVIMQPEPEAKELAKTLEIYTKGSLSVFAHKTNVEVNNRFIVYDIKDLGKQLKTLGLLIVLDAVWNRICKNREKGIRTWLYIDEIYLLFKNDLSSQFIYETFKRIRKYGGSCTGITQDVDELLKSDMARTMLSNCSFTMMLSQSHTNRRILADIFGIGEEQLSYVKDVEKGQGLLRAGSVIIPFTDKFPTNTKLYRLMTTNTEEIKEYRMQDELKNKKNIFRQNMSTGQMGEYEYTGDFSSQYNEFAQSIADDEDRF